ncbi:hypothetical protein TNCV_4057531 [Trichonephila clavipes]|nr:hypothetical protein TNCV_4057531 [Trichonephila clavipes]
MTSQRALVFFVTPPFSTQQQDHDSNSFNGQRLFPIVFSEKLGTSGDMLTGYMCRPSSMYRPRPTTILHHYPFSQKAAIGRAGLCDCKSYTFICFGSLFTRVFDNICHVLSTFMSHSCCRRRVLPEPETGWTSTR